MFVLLTLRKFSYNNMGVCSQKREVLHVLRRAVLGHNVQHHDAQEDVILHGEPHHPVHGDLVPDGARLLSAFR